MSAHAVQFVSAWTLSILRFIDPLPACSWKMQSCSLRIDWKNCGSLGNRDVELSCAQFFRGLKTVTQLLDRNSKFSHHKTRIGKRLLTRWNRKLPAAVWVCPLSISIFLSLYPSLYPSLYSTSIIILYHFSHFPHLPFSVSVSFFRYSWQCQSTLGAA